MNLSNQKNITAYKRSHDRVSFKHQVILELSDKKIFHGILQDVSLRGVFLILNDSPIGIKTGDEGFLQITLSNQPKKFPCKLAHIRNQGIGLQMLDKGIQFGASLTEALMQETHQRLGEEINQNKIIPVILHRTSLGATSQLEARLVKININHLEFSCLPMFIASEPLKSGERLKLDIHLPRHPLIQVEGTLQSTKNSQNLDHKNKTIHIVSFSATDENNSKAIQELIRLLHEYRLKHSVA